MAKEKQKKIKLPFPALVPVLVLAGIFLWATPAMREFRETTLWIIGSRIAESAVFIWLGFFAKEEHAVIGKIALSCAAVLPWFEYFSKSGRIAAIGIFAVFLILVLAASWNLFLRERPCLFLWYSAFYLLIQLALVSRQINILGDEKKYLLVPFAFAFICWFLLLALSKKGYIYIPELKNDSFLLVAACFCAAALLFTMPAINYMFDTSEGVSQVLEIENKRISRHAKNRDDYYITVDYNGTETDLQISAGFYRSLKIGDDVTVTAYEGFLGDEYVIVSE